ncbi:hypothetical protein V6N13_083591 [Hibiscus sabdariffa]
MYGASSCSGSSESFSSSTVPILPHAASNSSTTAFVPVEVTDEPSHSSSSTHALSNAVQDEVPPAIPSTQLITEQDEVMPSPPGVSSSVEHESSSDHSSMTVLPDTSAPCPPTQLNQHAMITRRLRVEKSTKSKLMIAKFKSNDSLNLPS